MGPHMAHRKISKARSRRGDGKPLRPGEGVVAILKEIGNHQLKVVGTGFLLTRYGTFATARHVLDDLADYQSNTLCPSYIFQDGSSDGCFFRRIVGISVSNTADVGIGQVENGAGSTNNLELQNLRGPIALTRPKIGEALVSYAYPENAILDFRIQAESPYAGDVPLEQLPTLAGRYIHGKFLSQIDAGSRPFIPYPHYETSLEIRSGASGCPIFNASGRIVAIACRGWDFQGGEYEGDDLSSVVPVTQLLPLELGCIRIPHNSWEFLQVPPSRRASTLTFAELITYGHVDVGAL
jgi:hypothetical protein